MKVNIRFLKQGLVKVDAPDDFSKMSLKEKMEWANDMLAKFTDKDIVEAMYELHDTSGGQFFDEPPLAAAIEDSASCDTIVQTSEWNIFSSGTGMDIIAGDAQRRLMLLAPFKI